MAASFREAEGEYCRIEDGRGKKRWKSLLGGGFKYFAFSSLFGETIQLTRGKTHQKSRVKIHLLGAWDYF